MSINELKENLMQMLDQRPYLLRSFHEWISDSGCTPYMAVDCSHPEVCVPTAFIEDNNTIVLNISLGATGNLEMGDEVFSFSGRFSGRVEMINVPIDAIMGIFAKETGVGINFQPVKASVASNESLAELKANEVPVMSVVSNSDTKSESPDKGSLVSKVPFLKVVK